MATSKKSPKAILVAQWHIFSFHAGILLTDLSGCLLLAVTVTDSDCSLLHDPITMEDPVIVGRIMREHL